MIEVEIWSDFVCPFCYIGKRNFEKALEQLGNPAEFKITYRSFELNPTEEKSQKKGSIYALLANKYGKTTEWAKEANKSVTATAKSVGLTYNMDEVIPTNSFDAHRLSHLAAKSQKQDQVLERLFTAYFTEGKDVADPQILKTISLEAGLNESDIQSLLTSQDFATEVRQDEETARKIGVTGVPFFVFDRKFAVSGAQPPEAFVAAIRKIQEG